MTEAANPSKSAVGGGPPQGVLNVPVRQSRRPGGGMEVPARDHKRSTGMAFDHSGEKLGRKGSNEVSARQATHAKR